MIQVPVADFAEWRSKARSLLRSGHQPGAIYFLPFQQGQPMLDLETAAPNAPKSEHQTRVPAEFLSLAQTVSYFREPERWNWLYSLLWRLTHGEAHLLADHAEPAVRRLRIMEKAVRRDIHKMHAFVRFRQTKESVYVAWYQPDHLIVRAAAPFFVRRFGPMHWAILTGDECAYWDTTELRFGPGLPRNAAPDEDHVEDLWLAYYGSIFNPARLNLAAMAAEMPAKHWSTLPEAATIAALVREAPTRTTAMVLKQPKSAEPFLPAERDLPALKEAASQCQGCDLYRNATQTVFGAGPPQARVMLVGEQPGDQEDQQGLPFVGPAGELLHRALAAAGIDADQIYFTNAVKHFHFEERDKRRIHKTPRGTHISACRPWLEAEIVAIDPEVIVCLGATAAQALLGKVIAVTSERGKLLSNRWDKKLLVTLHPAALLRLPDPSRFEDEFAQTVRDLSIVRALLEPS